MRQRRSRQMQPCPHKYLGPVYLVDPPESALLISAHSHSLFYMNTCRTSSPRSTSSSFAQAAVAPSPRLALSRLGTLAVTLASWPSLASSAWLRAAFWADWIKVDHYIFYLSLKAEPASSLSSHLFSGIPIYVQVLEQFRLLSCFSSWNWLFTKATVYKMLIFVVVYLIVNIMVLNKFCYLLKMWKGSTTLGKTKYF